MQEGWQTIVSRESSPLPASPATAGIKSDVFRTRLWYNRWRKGAAKYGHGPA